MLDQTAHTLMWVVNSLEFTCRTHTTPELSHSANILTSAEHDSHTQEPCVNLHTTYKSLSTWWLIHYSKCINIIAFSRGTRFGSRGGGFISSIAGWFMYLYLLVVCVYFQRDNIHTVTLCVLWVLAYKHLSVSTPIHLFPVLAPLLTSDSTRYPSLDCLAPGMVDRAYTGTGRA